jgi:hypothetical protein
MDETLGRSLIEVSVVQAAALAVEAAEDVDVEIVLCARDNNRFSEPAGSTSSEPSITSLSRHLPVLASRSLRRKSGAGGLSASVRSCEPASAAASVWMMGCRKSNASLYLSKSSESLVPTLTAASQVAPSTERLQRR